MAEEKHSTRTPDPRSHHVEAHEWLHRQSLCQSLKKDRLLGEDDRACVFDLTESAYHIFGGHNFLVSYREVNAECV